MKLQDARIFVITFAKYANGNLSGQWLNLSDYSTYDAFETACKELHKDEKQPELMFTDWENIPSGMIEEHSLYGGTFELIEKTKDWGEMDKNALYAFLDYFGIDAGADAENVISEFENRYIGYYASPEEYAREMATELYNIPEEIECYIDYSAIARDLFICDYAFCDGFVFRRF